MTVRSYVPGLQFVEVVRQGEFLPFGGELLSLLSEPGKVRAEEPETPHFEVSMDVTQEGHFSLSTPWGCSCVYEADSRTIHVIPYQNALRGREITMRLDGSITYETWDRNEEGAQYNYHSTLITAKKDGRAQLYVGWFKALSGDQSSAGIVEKILKQNANWQAVMEPRDVELTDWQTNVGRDLRDDVILNGKKRVQELLASLDPTTLAELGINLQRVEPLTQDEVQALSDHYLCGDTKDTLMDNINCTMYGVIETIHGCRCIQWDKQKWRGSFRKEPTGIANAILGSESLLVRWGFMPNIQEITFDESRDLSKNDMDEPDIFVASEDSATLLEALHLFYSRFYSGAVTGIEALLKVAVDQTTDTFYFPY